MRSTEEIKQVTLGLGPDKKVGLEPALPKNHDAEGEEEAPRKDDPEQKKLNL